MRPYFSIVPLIFQRLCDDYQCLILVFSVICLDSWGYIGWGPFQVFENFRSLFSFLHFLFFFSFLFFHFLFCLSLSPSRGPFSSWAPGHCPPMPPSRYATACNNVLLDRLSKNREEEEEEEEENTITFR